MAEMDLPYALAAAGCQAVVSLSGLSLSPRRLHGGP
jgi:hypothetical protein